MQELTKQAARAIIRDRLKTMTESERNNRSNIIMDKVINSGECDSAKTILLYKALPKEVNVDSLIQYCLKLNKQVYLPRVNGDNIELVLYSGRFAVGAYGVLEPLGDSSQTDIDLAIIPLLGIDNNLNRLGKGKGYYDRFLACSGARKVAVAFSGQVMASLPIDKFDICMDICYTDDITIKKQ